MALNGCRSGNQARLNTVGWEGPAPTAAPATPAYPAVREGRRLHDETRPPDDHPELLPRLDPRRRPRRSPPGRRQPRPAQAAHPRRLLPPRRGPRSHLDRPQVPRLDQDAVQLDPGRARIQRSRGAGPPRLARPGRRLTTSMRPLLDARLHLAAILLALLYLLGSSNAEPDPDEASHAEFDRAPPARAGAR